MNICYNRILQSIFVICITTAAVDVDNGWIRWWYMIVPFAGAILTGVKKNDHKE